MKILLTVHQFFPDHMTGTEVLTLSVANALRDRGHEVRVLTGAQGESLVEGEDRLDSYVYDDFSVYRATHPRLGDDPTRSAVKLRYSDPLVDSYFDDIIQEFKPDLIHLFHLDRLGVGIIDKALEAGIPTFFTPTDFWSVCPMGQLLLPNEQMCRGPGKHAGNCVKHLLSLKFGPKADQVTRMVPNGLWDPLTALLHGAHKEVDATHARAPFILERLNKLNGILAPNQLMEEILIENGVDKTLITRAAYGIKQNKSHARQARTESGPLRVGFIGTLARHKGCHVLVDAFNGMTQGQASLQIYGNTEQFPDYIEELKRKTANNPDVAFCGPFPNQEIARVLGNLDVLVVPSIWFENTPLVVYSAQLAQCPIIASDLPGLNEAVSDGVNGLTFKAKDSAALQKALIRLLEEPDLLEQLRGNIQPPKTIDHYTNDLHALWEPHL